MGLADIAEGLEVTLEQCERGVATVDETDRSIAERLAPVADALPCEPTEAATLVDAYADGTSVDQAATVAGLPATTAAKTLHLLGEPIDPLTPTARRVLDDWLAGEISRTDARTLAGVGKREFALGAYVATHDPIPAAEEAVASALSTPAPEDPLADARGNRDEWI